MESRSEEQLRNALRRFRAGTGGGTGSMTRLEAWVVIDDAITELLGLRSYVTEWVCRKCQVVFTAEGLCPRCEGRLTPHWLLQLEAFDSEITHLQQRVQFLEEVTKAGLSLEDF